MKNLTHSRKIGSFYLIFAILAGVVGVALSLLIRFELSNEGASYLPLPEFWLSSGVQQIISKGDSPFLPLITSSHALIMIVFMMGPALFGGFANWLVPMMIGAENMVFPRLNLLAFLLLPSGFLTLLGLVFLAPTPSIAVVLLVVTLHLLTISFILSAINFIATILGCRAAFMRFRDMPSFVWSVLVASFFSVAALPVMSAALTLALGKLAYGTSVALASPNPLPQLPVMMWFFTHPEFFILMLPAFGIISEVIAAFSGGQLVMRKSVNAAFVTIGTIGFILWCQATLSVGLSGEGTDGNVHHYQEYFSFVMAAFALPVSVILVSWLVTIGQRPCLQPVPMLWALGFIVIMLMAVLSSGSMRFSDALSSGAEVGHFHYILGLSGVFAIFAGWYFWFGKISGYEMRPLSGKLHFWMMFIAVHLTFLPQHFAATARSANAWEPNPWGHWIEANISWQHIATLGACLSALSLLLFFYAILEARLRKCPVPANPWGQGARGMEWQLTSPPQDQGGRIPVSVRIISS